MLKVTRDPQDDEELEGAPEIASEDAPTTSDDAGPEGAVEGAESEAATKAVEGK